MEFFNNAKAIRLRSHLNKYLVATDDEETVRQSRTGSSRQARWAVEFVPDKANVIRLKGCYGRYLTASDEAFLLGWTGRKVVQTLPTSKMDPSTEWEPIKEGFHVKLRAKGGKFLRANGGTPPWKNSITHDVPQRTATQDWVLWSVDIVDITHSESPANYISRASSFSSQPDDFTCSDTGSPSMGSFPGSPVAFHGRSRLASSRQIPAHQEDGDERSKSQMDHVDKPSEKTNFTTSKAREKTFDATWKIPVEQEVDNGRSKPEMHHVDTASDQTNFNPWKPSEQISKPVRKITPDHEAGYGRSKSQIDNADKPSDQTNFSPPNPRDQTHDLNSSPKAPDVVPSTIPTAVSYPTVKTTASMAKQLSTQMEDKLNSVFSELESIVSDVGSSPTSFSEPRMEDEALEMSAVPSREEIRQALVALKECLLLEFSQLKQARVRAKLILALSTLSIAEGSLSQEQMDATHYFLSNFNVLMMKFDRAERQSAECNNFFRDKNRAYDELREINESNLELKARIDQLNEEEEELLRRIEEIRGMKTKLANKRIELGEESKSALSKWNEFGSLEPAALSRQRKFEKRRHEILEDWSNLKALFD
ncbi:hypothetical protein PVL29_019235 [Vitis rotundifolia]|uniref:DUF569 domain-containing protein n=1 Tax=Vitis rotundifolia TaxID=103349 RepID=A0AA39DIQ4_VITRO|nr:hypothetical protein PVL29_019235 [Vitis rotundifolia]